MQDFFLIFIPVHYIMVNEMIHNPGWHVLSVFFTGVGKKRSKIKASSQAKSSKRELIALFWLVVSFFFSSDL